MPPGHLTFAADAADLPLLAQLITRFPSAEQTDGGADVLITASAPASAARHVIATGPVDEALDAWDQNAAPQTVAGALWIPSGQEALDPATAWILLRSQTPATPLSDLTDDNGRALRWSVVGARAVCFPAAEEVEVDEAGVRGWIDEQPQVQELGRAVEQIGGESAEAVLDSSERFQDALLSLDELAQMPPLEQTRSLANAVAAQLQQVQRSGLSRWRSGKARAQAEQATRDAAKDLAAQRLITLIEARSKEVAQDEWAERNRAIADQIHDAIRTEIDELTLPVPVDFTKVPRGWSDSAPPPRRYVLVNEEQAEHLQSLGELPGLALRPSPEVVRDTAICAIVQSGFSLPALR